jgi:hypothetical protein
MAKISLNYESKRQDSANLTHTFYAAYPVRMSNPFQCLATLPYVLCHPTVRDIAWVITSPPILDIPEQRHPLAASDWTAKPEELANWLHDLDRRPAPLLAWLAQGNDRRLGRYYELLWQFSLRHAPGVALRGANLPLRIAAQTLGELDLLIEDDEGFHHVEVAIKYYLATGSPFSPDWLGPGGEDQLQRKLSHLLTRQLPLSQRAEALELLSSLGIHKADASLWMSGYLFYPIGQTVRAFPACHTHHLKGDWLRYDQIAHLYGKPGLILPKQRWLAPAQQDENYLRFDENSEPRWPQQLVQFNEQGHESCRLFCVPNQWPNMTGTTTT